MRKFLIILALLAICVGYLLLSPPSTLVVDSNGKIKTTLDRWRSEIQGNKFWIVQLHLLDEEIYKLKEPIQTPSSDEIQKLSQDTDQLMEDLYKKMPEIRPSKAAQEAQRLREKADQIESAEMMDKMQEFTLQRIDALTKLRPLIASRAQDTEQGAAANP